MRRILIVLFLSGCALHHTRGGDGDASSADAAALDGSVRDAASLDAASTDAPPDALPADVGPLVRCGPNTCRAREICCIEECGVCAFPAECDPTSCH